MNNLKPKRRERPLLPLAYRIAYMGRRFLKAARRTTTTGEAEAAKRRRQIERGQLRFENGLNREYVRD